jgi:hypothetical protein
MILHKFTFLQMAGLSPVIFYINVPINRPIRAVFSARIAKLSANAFILCTPTQLKSWHSFCFYKRCSVKIKKGEI